MNRNSVFTKVVAWMICALMMIGFLPSTPIIANAEFTPDEWEVPIDPADTTEPAPEPGSAEAPIALTELENTIIVPAGATMYFSSRHNGMIMTVTGASGYEIVAGEETTADVDGIVTMDIVCASTYEPFIFAVVNNTEDEVEYSVNFAQPTGSMENPMIAYLGENIAEVDANDKDGFYMSYVADYTGKLAFAISADDGWVYAINNLTTGQYGDTQWSDSDPVADTVTLDVTEGDELQIMVNTYNPEDMWNTPAGEICVELSYVPGSCPEQGIFLFEMENTVINAGTLYYQGYFSNTIMTVSGEGDFVVNYNGEAIAAVDGVVSVPVSSPNPRMPVQFAIVGDGEYVIKFEYPIGDQNNPLIAQLGDNEANVAAKNNMGFMMTYIADYTGKLQVTISSEDGNWVYTINNLTTYAYGDTQWSDSDPVVNPAVIDVTAGDEIQIIVNTYNPADMWNTPAGVITVNLAYVPGSCAEQAIFLPKMENTVTNAGTVYYQGHFSNTIMTVSGEGEFTVDYNGDTIAAVDGVVSIPVSSPNPRMPVLFSITGDGEFDINFAYPVGSAANPHIAQLGDNVASVEANNQFGYYFNFTAPQAGDLIATITSADGNWMYTINNLTKGTYGDAQWNDSDPVVNPATVTVAEGDVLEIVVNTYNPAEMWNTPAGEITVNLAYYVAPTPTNELKFRTWSLTLKSDLTVNFQVEAAVYKEYKNMRAEFTIVDGVEEHETVVVTEPVLLSNGRYSFQFAGVAPYRLKDTIQAKLYGTFEGVEYVVEKEYKVVKYCQALMPSGGVVGTVAVNLVNFATMQQIYMSHNTNDLINSDLTDDQKDMGTYGKPTWESKLTTKHVVIDNPTASFKGVTLDVQSIIRMRFTVQLPEDTTGIVAYITADNGAVLEVPFEEFEATTTANRYYIYFSGMRAVDMRKCAYVCIKQNGTVISNTLRYSIESYCATSYVEGSNLGNLLEAMINYGDAVEKY